MPIFDVTVTRTGCVMVEADNEHEAMMIAANQPTEDISWTEDWEAFDANEIAKNEAEMGEDMALVVKDPLIKAKILVKESHGHMTYGMMPDGRMIVRVFDPTEEKLVDAIKAFEPAGFAVQRQCVTRDETVLDGGYKFMGKIFTESALCNWIKIMPDYIPIVMQSDMLVVETSMKEESEHA